MISVNKILNDYVIKFGGDNFEEILQEVKSYHLKYDPQYRVFKTNNRRVLHNLCESLKTIEPFRLQKSISDEIQPDSKLRYYRLKFKPELLRLPPIKGKPPYENYQVEDIIRGLHQNSIYYAQEMGSGKAQPLTSQVLTPEGYSNMGDLKVGDDIMNSKGGVSQVLDIYPQGVKDVYEVQFADGTTARSTEDHLWAVKTANDRFRKNPNRILPLKAFKDNLYDGANNRKYFIDMVAPIQFKKKELIVPPYLLGVLLGDGCLVSSVSFSTPDEFILEKVRKLIPKSLQITSHKGCDYSITNGRKGLKNPLLDSIRSLGLMGKKSPEKHIPEQYLLSSIEDRTQLLQGLLDTDGYVSIDSSVEFYSTSKELAKGLRFLVYSLGGQTTWNKQRSFLNGKEYLPCYVLTVRLPKETQPVTLPKKLERYKPNYKYKPVKVIKAVVPIGKEECQCIRVNSPDNLYITDGMTLTHNTYITIGALNHHIYYGTVDKILVLCPSAALYNWKRELLRFNSFNLKEEEIYIATSKTRTPFTSDIKVAIMTYDSFRIISNDAYKGKAKKYKKPSIDLAKWSKTIAFVGDEFHKVKDRTTLRTHILDLYKNFFKLKYVLSGTPFPNEVDELWSQIEFLDSELIYKDYYSFLRSIANLGDAYSEYTVNYYYEEKVAALMDKIKPLFIRRFTREIVELNELVEKKVFFELNDKQNKIYQELVVNVLKVIKEEEGALTPKIVFQKFPYILQAVHDPCLLQGKIAEYGLSKDLFKLIEKWKFKDNSRLPMIDSLMDTYIKEEKKKVIIWSGHPDTMDRLGEHYKKYNPTVIHGGTAKDERDPMLESFKCDPKKHVLIASYLVLKEAVNITESSRTIYFDRDFSLTNFLQSSKRNDRIGQEDTVFLTTLISVRTIEEAQDRDLDRKGNLNRNLLNKDSLTKEEWRSIFEGGQI